MMNIFNYIPVLGYFIPILLCYLYSYRLVSFSKNELRIIILIFIVDVVSIFIYSIIQSLKKKVIQTGEIINVRYYTNKSELGDDNTNCELTVRFLFENLAYIIKCRVLNIKFYKEGSIVDVDVNVENPEKSVVMESIRGSYLAFLVSFPIASAGILWQLIKIMEE